MKAYERLLNYVKILTPSNENSQTVPSSDCQFNLARILEKEMNKLGLTDVYLDDKCYLYCISLGLAILSNYYIAIMICITLVIYFVICMILAKGKNFNYPKKILNFGLFSLLAGGLAGVVLFPEIAALSYTASGNFSFPKDWSSYFFYV